LPQIYVVTLLTLLLVGLPSRGSAQEIQEIEKAYGAWTHTQYVQSGEVILNGASSQAPISGLRGIFMHVLCEEGKLTSEIFNGATTNLTEYTTEVSYDAGKNWEAINAEIGSPFSHLPPNHLRKLMGASIIYVRWTMPDDNSHTDSFSLKGAAAALAPVMRACGLLNQAMAGPEKSGGVEQGQVSNDPLKSTAPGASRSTEEASDAACREIAQREYPNDARMQEYVYNKQFAAMRYMRTVTDEEVRKIALREYPYDFSMQKFIYDKQLAAKDYMNTRPSSPAKSSAQHQYPYDYSMQKYIYDRSLR
jgi:hypothetical protein